MPRAAQPLKWGSASKKTQRGTFGLEWHLPSAPAAGTPTMCGTAKEGKGLTLGCASGAIKSVVFAECGAPRPRATALVFYELRDLVP